MSNTSMLEQAIVDAETLKEAALKNAESTILEKYSTEVEKAVNSLLEQEEVMMPPPMPMPVPGEEPLEEDAGEQFEDVPHAHYQKEDLDEDQEVDIDLDKLAEELQKELSEDEEVQEGKVEKRAGGPYKGEPIDIAIPKEREEERDKAAKNVSEEKDETIELTEEQLASIIEMLSGLPEPVPSGQAGGASNKALDRENADIALAHQTLEEEDEEEEEETKNENKKLKESVKKLQKDQKTLFEQNKKYKNLLVRVKEKLEEVNLSNAKLLYMNRTLSSTSLNERQRTKIVESIQKTDSVEEAKVIYETLQSAVGSSSRVPKSLSEAIRKPSLSMPSRMAQKSSKEIIVKERFQRLAGISKTDK